MSSPFLLIGHRGARGLFPENTLEGFRRCMSLGLVHFEIDVGMTKDGVAVVHHDLALNTEIASLGGRYLSGSLPLLKALPFDELRDFDVGRIRPGSDTAARFPHQQPIDGQAVPSLAEVLALGAGLHWTIELKLQPDRPEWTVGVTDMVAAVLADVDAAGAADRVVLQSFDWRAPRLVRRLRPELACAWLTEVKTVAEPALWWDRAAAATVPDAVAEEGGGRWSPHFTELTPALLERAHALGLTVVPWTVNEAADMQRLAEWGVDGLITDYPDRFPGALIRSDPA